MVAQLPSGRWQARVWVDGRKVAAARILDDQTLRELKAERGTFRTEKQARRAASMAELSVGRGVRADTTVREFWDRWTTDPLFERPKTSTNRHNRERTKAFVERFGAVPIVKVSDDHVSEWLRGGKRNGTVPALRCMFNDARSAKAGRLVSVNPFSGLGLSKGSGNRFKHPPSPEMVQRLIDAGREAYPSFGDWLQVAAATGMRPAEVDALRWENVDLAGSRIGVVEQFNARSWSVTLPKNGKRRQALVTPNARVVLERLDMERGDGDGFVFSPPHARHFTGPGRDYYWRQVKRSVGYADTLYLATRHFFGWYAVNVLRLESEDVAIVMGHEDGGTLVRLLYGHRNRDLAMDRALAAFEDVGSPRLLAVGE